MTFPKYEAYKDSGVEWLGEVPKHWKLICLRWLIQTNSGDFISNTEIERDPTDNETIPVVGGNGVMAYTSRKNTSKNTIVVGRVGAHCGNVHLLKANSWVTDNALRISFLSDETYPEYIFKLFRALNFNDSAHKNAQPLITGETIKSQYIALPSIAEQTQIARFLDHETARIDALIVEQERLIELLKEKRQAVISHAVTKGCDSTVPMKDSGVEWLGEVPAHWSVSCLKRFWSVTDCKHITAEFVDDGIPLASIREVQSRFVNLGEAKQTTELFYEQLIEGGRKPIPGDLIFSRNATVGEVAQVTEWHPPFAMGQDVCLLRKESEDFSSDYFQAVLRSTVVTEQLENLMVGATFKRINVEEIRGLVVPMPPQDEQSQIADYLEQETTAFDALLVEATHTIELLQERRSALISAAVTGKIDVRDWQPPASDAPAATLEAAYG